MSTLPPTTAPGESRAATIGVDPPSRPTGSEQGGVRAFAAVPRSGTLRYKICVAILAASALGMVALGQFFAGIFHKDAVPLLKPIPAMDAARLSPEFILHPQPAELLDEETLSTLGTHDYLIWRLVDPTKKREDPTCVAHLFITYYTGKPDMVPHLPDECYNAAGSRMLQAVNTTVTVPGVRAVDDRLPVRATVWRMPPPVHAAFIDPEGGSERSVVYFFHCNGKYMLSRTDVRLAQADPTERFAYYAKIEVNFTDYTFRRNASLDESLAALPKLMGKVMKTLLTDHFPDWKELNARANAKSAEAK